MRRDQRVDGAAEFAKRPMGACLILAHQAAETDHIGMQNSGKLPLPRGRFPRRVSRVIEQSAHRGAFDLAADCEHHTLKGHWSSTQSAGRRSCLREEDDVEGLSLRTEI